MSRIVVRASIARAAILPVAGVVAIIATAVVILVSELNQRRTTDGLVEKAALTSRILASNAAAFVWDLDMHKGLGLLQSIATDPDFEAGVILDARGNPFASFQRDTKAAEIFGASTIAKLSAAKADGPPSMSLGRTHVLAERIVAVADLNGPRIGNEYLGSLALSFSRTRAREAVKRERSATIVGGIVTLALVCGLLAMVLTRVTHPIREMTTAMRRLADGEIGIEVPAMERRDEIGAMAHALSVFRNFAYRATHDSLTDLPNRALLRERLEKATADCRATDRRFALHLLDLDRFKEINDQLGHAAGDELLRVFAARLQSCVSPGDTVARLGGDEFCILQWTDDPDLGAGALASKILVSMSTPVELEGQRRIIGTSIGIAIAPLHGRTQTDLLKNADLALYQVKEQGRGAYQIFGKETGSDASQQDLPSLFAMIEGFVASDSGRSAAA